MSKLGALTVYLNFVQVFVKVKKLSPLRSDYIGKKQKMKIKTYLVVPSFLLRQLQAISRKSFLHSKAFLILNKVGQWMNS